MRPSLDALAQVAQHALLLGHLNEGHPAVIFYDLGAIDARAQRLQRCFPEGPLHAVAIKAAPLPLRRAVEAGCGLEAASLPELALAAAAGAPAKLVFDSPARNGPELRHALQDQAAARHCAGADGTGITVGRFRPCLATIPLPQTASSRFCARKTASRTSFSSG